MKIGSVIVAGLLLSFSLKSQVTTEFYRTFHFNNTNYGKDIVVTSEYRLAVIGWTYSYGISDSYASPLIILDELGYPLDTLFLPWQLSTIIETGEGNYLAGGDDFTCKVSPAGDSIWEKPYPAGQYGSGIKGLVQLNDSVFIIHATRYTGENQQDPYAKIVFLDENGDFISENTLTAWPAHAVDLEKTPDGRGIALARPETGVAVFLGEAGGLEKEVNIPLGPTDLVIANDSTCFIIGATNNGPGILRTDQFFNVIAYRDDLYPHKFYSGCLLNDTILALAAQSDEALYIGLLDFNLNLLGVDTLTEFAGLSVDKVISPAKNRLALTGYTWTDIESTDLVVLSLAVEPFYQHTPELPFSPTLHVYPNPSKGIYYVDGTFAESTAEIYSLDGRAVQFAYLQDSDRMRIDLRQSEPGIYFLSIKSPVGTSVMRLIKTL